MTKKEYSQAHRLTDRERAAIWHEIRTPFSRHRERPRRWLPAVGGLAAVACALAVALLLNVRDETRGPAPAHTDVAVRSSEQPVATPPVPDPVARSVKSADSIPETAALAAAAPARGVIDGTVRDGETGTPLAYANVVLAGTGVNAITDADGRFTVLNVPPGKYDIQMLSLGYKPGAAEVAVAAGDTAVVAMDLEVEIVETLAAFDVDAARYMVEIKNAGQARDIRSETFQRYAIDSVEKAVSRQAGITMGAESGGTRNPNDRPYDLVYNKHYGVNPFVATDEDALSTFAMEVDDASWTMARRYLRDGNRPPAAAIRVEEMVNRLDSGLAQAGDEDFSIHVDGMPSRFGEGYHLLRVGVRARDVSAAERPAANLVFVIDISGSMNRENRLGLVKKALRVLVDELKTGDTVGIVVYGNTASIVLEPTAIENRAAILSGIDQVQAGGSTNAEAGLAVAYKMAREHMVEGAISRLILCTDGVANVGATGPDSILESTRREADEGISLTAVGFGMGNYNAVMLEELALRGDGTCHYVDQLEDAERAFRQNLTGTLQNVGKEVKAQVEFDPDRVLRWRLLGYENRDVADEDFRNDAVDAGEIGAGHTAVALYEVKLAGKAAGRLGTVRLRWAKPRYHEDSGKVTEIERPITTHDLAPSWSDADPHLRAAAVTAEFAEILRESYWARGSEIDGLLPLVTELVGELPDDPDILDLAQMVRRTRSLESPESP